MNKAIYSRFKYASDFGVYVDLLTNKEVKVSDMRSILETIEKTLTLDQFEKLLDLLKKESILRADISALAKRAKKASKSKDEPSRVSLLNDAYSNVRKDLRVYIHVKDDARIMYYVDPINEVYPCYKEEFDGFSVILLRHKNLLELLEAEFMRDENEPIRVGLRKDQFFQEMYSRLKFDGKKIMANEPQAISWDAAVPAYKQLDPAILQPLPTPTWDQFTSRLDFGDHFKAFVWSIFEPRNKGRQALYLYGAGFDGKSSAFNAIANVLGDRHTMSIDNEKLKNTQFFYGNVHGKRLVLYPDCKVTSVIRHEIIKSLLGNDKVQVNRKNRDAFNSSVQVKLMIGSNRYPRIDSSDKSERTRLMFLKVRPIEDNRGDYMFEANLRAEIGPFLYQCRAAYEKLCPTHSEFTLPEEMVQNIKMECNSQDADALEDFMEDQLVFGPRFFAIKKEVDKLLAEHLTSANIKQVGTSMADTLQVQLSKHGVTQRRQLIGKSKPTIYVGVRLTGTNFELPEDQIKVPL